MSTQNSKRILYVVNDLSQSHGWSTYACNIIEEACVAGYEVHVAVEKKFPTVISTVSQHEVLYSPQSVIWHPGRIFLQWLRLRKLMASIRPDIVHVIVEPYLQAFAFRVDKSFPVVLSLHGTYATLPLTVPKGYRRWASTFFFWRALAQTKRIICVSNATKEKFSQYCKRINVQQLVVVHNSIKMPPENNSAAEKNIDNVHALVTVGAVKRRKGIHTTIKTFAEWARLRKEAVVYHVVGQLNRDTEYVRQVLLLAEHYRSEFFRVEFHGQVDDVAKQRILQSASLYVHLESVDTDASDVEGFGIGIIEAASYGIPALVARGSATAEAVRDGFSGYVVDLEGVTSVYATIDNLLKKKTISRATAIEWAKAHAPERIFLEIDAVYRSVRNS